MTGRKGMKPWFRVTHCRLSDGVRAHIFLALSCWLMEIWSLYKRSVAAAAADNATASSGVDKGDAKDPAPPPILQTNVSIPHVYTVLNLPIWSVYFRQNI